MEPVRGWNDHQFDEALALRNAGLSYPEIGRLIGRTSDAVRAKFRVKGGWRPRPPGMQSRGPSDKYLRDITIKQDQAFQARMKEAIELGLEKAPIGIFVDKRPFARPPFQFRNAVQLSGAGSSAALCAEMGQSIGAPWKS